MNIEEKVIEEIQKMKNCYEIEKNYTNFYNKIKELYEKNRNLIDVDFDPATQYNIEEVYKFGCIEITFSSDLEMYELYDMCEIGENIVDIWFDIRANIDMLTKFI